MTSEQEKLRDGQVRVGRCLAAAPGLLVAGEAFDELGGQFGVPEGERARPLTVLLVWTPSPLPGQVHRPVPITPGMTVLVNGAAGEVGHFAVQPAKWKGAHVVAVA